jgi:hypothetical protein
MKCIGVTLIKDQKQYTETWRKEFENCVEQLTGYRPAWRAASEENNWEEGYTLPHHKIMWEWFCQGRGFGIFIDKEK